MRFVMTDEQIKGKIIDRLARRGKWMHSHTSEDELTKGFPDHLRGEVKDIIKEMRRDSILIAKATKAGLHYSLNIHAKKEIERLKQIFLEMK